MKKFLTKAFTILLKILIWLIGILLISQGFSYIFSTSIALGLVMIAGGLLTLLAFGIYFNAITTLSIYKGRILGEKK